MKNMLCTFLMALCLKATVFAQTQLVQFNPFNFTVYNANAIAMASDTSGEIWFAAFDSVGDSLHVLNESHTRSLSLVNTQIVPEMGNFMIDGRNGIWFLDRDGAHKDSGSTFSLFKLPGMISNDSLDSEILQIADNHRGSNYFLWTLSNFDSGTDSLYLTRYDGTNFFQVNLTALGDTLSSSIYYSAPGLFCDYIGNAYLLLDSITIHKYNGTSFTDITSQLPGDVSLFSDYSGNIFVDDHEETIYKMLPTGQLQTIYTHGAGNILCSNMMLKRDSTIWMYDENNDIFKYSNGQLIPQANLMFSSFDECLFCATALFDKYNNIVFSSFGCGNIVMYSFTGFNLINGTVFIDANQNGIQDNGEIGVPGLNVIQQPDNYAANTDSSGNYAAIFIDSTVTHTVSLAAPVYYHATTPSAYTLQPLIDSLCCYNFGIAPDANIQDLQISATGWYAVRGFNNMQWLSYQNIGTTTLSDTITYFFDPSYTFVSAQPVPDVIYGNTLKWSYNSLAPFNLGNIGVELYLDSAVQAGTVLYDSAVINPLATDTTPVNNISVLQQLVVSAFDPNEKSVSPSGPIVPGQQLVYTIFFQNTGNAVATNVVIYDTLDPNLNFSTFKILGYSKPVQYQFKGAGIIAFTFNNILLPDSHSNEAGSQGFVKYSIQADSNMATGTDIRNTAYIVFDFNAPVVTNTTNSTYGVNNIEPVAGTSGFKIYPNPNTGEFIAELNGYNLPDEVSLTDLEGRKVWATKNVSAVMKISVSGISRGIYIFSATGNGAVLGRQKVVIE